MKKVNQCLILAAGNGTRIRSVSAGLPKPLVDFRGKPILEHVIRRAQRAGIEKFVIVVGYRSDLIRGWFDDRSLGASVTWVENPDYHKSNGISALMAKDEIHENFLLLMADHIFEPETAEALHTMVMLAGGLQPNSRALQIRLLLDLRSRGWGWGEAADSVGVDARAARAWLERLLQRIRLADSRTPRP